MKRYINSKETTTPKLNIVVEVEFLNSNESVSAAKFNPENFKDSKLPPAAKDALIDTQVLADFHAFVETLEDLLKDYFELSLYYKNDSPYNSFYFGALAVDDNGNYIIDCEATIRVSTHTAHRTSESQREKALQKAKLKSLIGDKRMEPVRRSIIINDIEFDNYEDAYTEAFEKIKSAANVLNRKKK